MFLSEKPWSERVANVAHIYPQRAREAEKESAHYAKWGSATDAALYLARSRVEWVVALVAVLSWVKELDSQP